MWLAVVVSLIITAVALLLWYLRRNDDYWAKRGIPFTPRGNVISEVRKLLSMPLHEVVLDMYRENGRLYGFFLLWTPQLVVADPDLVRDILVKDFHIFSFRRDMAIGNQAMDNAVSSIKGEDSWKRVRAIITPAFTSKKIRNMAHIVNDCIKILMENLEKHAISKEPFDSRRLFGALTMNVIARSAFATKIDCHNDPDNSFVKNAKKIMEKLVSVQTLFALMLPHWLNTILGLNFITTTDFFRTVILEVIKERKQKGQRYNDFLQLLMDAVDEEIQGPEKSANAGFKLMEKNEDVVDQFGSVTNSGTDVPSKYTKLSQDELIAQCVMFFFVGYESTASTLSFMAYALALNPDCQEKLIQEVDGAFEKHAQMDLDVIREMKYLDCVVTETLRVYPVATATERTAVADYELGNTGLIIEKGMHVMVPIHAMHYDAEFFPQPGKFDPERWIKGSGKLNHPQYAYLPFGAGPRNCLGMRFALMEIKLSMVNILRHYRFKKAESTKEPLQYRKGTSVLSVTELPLLIEKRTEIQHSYSKLD